MHNENGEFEFTREHDGTLTVYDAVFQAIGAASVCWTGDSHLGLFDSTRAKLIGETLLDELRPHLREVDSRRLRRSMDAVVWAQEFVKVRPDVDEGLMIAWFANAIETARDILTSDTNEPPEREQHGQQT